MQTLNPSFANFGFEYEQIAHQLCALDESQRWSSLFMGYPSQEIEGMSFRAKFWRLGIPQFWCCYIPGYLGSGLMGLLVPTIAGSSATTRAIVTRLLPALMISLIWHPFKVAQLHYNCLPSKFPSVLHALIALYKLGPHYLWIGLPEALLAETVRHLITDEIMVRVRRTWPKRNILNPLHLTISFLLDTAIWYPFRIIATQSFAQTPFFRDNGIKTYSSSIVKHVQEVWGRFGILGFYKGAIYSSLHPLIGGSLRVLATQAIDNRFPGFAIRPSTSYSFDGVGAALTFITFLAAIDYVLPSVASQIETAINGDP